MNCLQ